MRRRRAVLLAVGLAAALVVVSSATPQDAAQTHYWPHRTFYIPVNVERINQTDPKPTHLQLHSALNRGRWQAGSKLALDGLQDLGDGKKGFKFEADRDGDYEFSVQYWYGATDSSPRKADELQPMLGVVIDTTPPDVRVVAGANGVRWQANDDNLDPRAVTLQAKYPTSTDWLTVTDRQFKTADSYAWQLGGRTLDVRVQVKDKAGNLGQSPVVRVPGNDAINTAFPKNTSPALPDWPPGGGGLPRDPLTPAVGHLPKPRIEYVAGKDITVDYTIQKAGRSGVQAAHLYVLKDQSPWQFVQRFAIQPPADTGKTLSLKYAADKEGVYGFFVAPESGAGVKADPPRKDDPPMLFVVVDETAPYVKITGVRVAAGGVRGPLVEIAWETADQNLMADPISLEYSEDRDAAQWKEVKYRLAPGVQRADGTGVTRYVGTYTWEVPTETLWKFHLRARSVDNAGNVGRDVWKDEVKVDLEKPSAGIIGVRGAAGGSAGGGGTSRPAPVKEPSAPAREPDPEPITPPPTKLPVKPPIPPVTGSPSGSGSPSGPPPVPALPAPPAKMMD